MSNYEKLYAVLFSGMSDLVDACHPVTAEARSLRGAMIELLRRCEELYIEGA